MRRVRDAYDLFAGEGEMRARCRALDWAATPLGPVEEWSQSLRTAVQMILASGFPNIVLWGPELVQIYNDGYRDLMGVKHPGGLGQPTHECWPEARHINGPIFERALGGETITLEDALYPLARRGGIEDAYFTLSFGPIRDDDGEVGGVLATVFETTQQVAARRLQADREQLLHALGVERAKLVEIFRQAPAFLAVLRGPEHVFELVNDAYYEVVGHRDIVGKPAVEALPEVRGQGFIELLDTVLETGEPFVGLEMLVRLARSPGAPPEERFVDFVYQPLTEPDGTRSAIVAHGSDVTEQVLARRQVERLLRESEEARRELQAAHDVAEAARADAERANRAKAEFLATMSHELRTPLNAIGGYAQLLELGIHGPVTAKQLEALHRIEASQRHLLALINQVLNYSRLEAGKVFYELQTVQLAEALAACEALTAPQMESKGLTYHTTGCDSRLAVRADRDKLQQIILNLLSNSIKFTATGGSITIECEVRDRVVALRVIDTGRGIPAERLEHVFEPFVQVDAGLTRTQEGAGLGLAISRDLARGMGGDLTATSVEGVGSTFTLTLPAAE